jgi:hypothetical protein
MPGCQGVAKRGATVKEILDRLLLQHNPDALLTISHQHFGCHPLVRCVTERAACVYAYSKRQASDRITRALAGYRTYRRSSRAYDVCGQSWTYCHDV